MFEKGILRLTSSLDALRDFLNLVELKLSKNFVDQVEKYSQTMKLLQYTLSSIEPDKIGLKELPDNELTDEDRARFDKLITIEKPSDGETPTKIRIGHTPEAEHINTVFDELKWHMRRSDQLFGSSLISLVSSIEWFFAEMLHTYFERFPDIAMSKDKAFSYADLSKFQDISEARQYLVEKKVEDILRSSFTEWIAYFKSPVGLSMSYLDEHMDDLVETCERRNLLVHNAGVVNKIYLTKVSARHTKEVVLNQKLKVTREYLNNRINLFESRSILISAELWKKVAPADTERAAMLSHVIFEHLKAGRWSISESLSFFLMSDKQMPERFVLVGRMNYWLSMKRQSKWAEVEQDVIRHDFSAKERIFQLAWYSLRDQNDDFFRSLDCAIGGGDIDYEALTTFPIFEEMRTDDRYSSAVRQLEEKVKPKNSNEAIVPN